MKTRASPSPSRSRNRGTVLRNSWIIGPFRGGREPAKAPLRAPSRSPPRRSRGSESRAPSSLPCHSGARLDAPEDVTELFLLGLQVAAARVGGRGLDRQAVHDLESVA